jgi:hypothetical protein
VGKENVPMMPKHPETFHIVNGMLTSAVNPRISGAKGLQKKEVSNRQTT